MDFFSYVKSILFLAVFSLFTTGCAQTGLADRYREYFDIGVAVSTSDLSEFEKSSIVKKHFNSLTHEFSMKWSQLEVKPGKYEFEMVDQFVAWGHEHGKKLVGHTLVWHKANPDWLFTEDDSNLSRAKLLARLEKHISTVVGRYKGKVYGWDVVNEAFGYDGTFRKSPWLNIIGEDFIERAFEFAHAADPDAKLYYNDYGLVHKSKQDAVVRLIQRLKSKGIPIHAVGIQGHYSLTYPDAKLLDEAISRFASLGVEVMISELDVSVLPFPGPEERGEDAEINNLRAAELDPYSGALPTDIEAQLADRYQELFCVLLAHRASVNRVTFWGISDAESWRNNWPLPERMDHPLLFDRNLKPKLVVERLLHLADEGECKES
ncbi:endo-1,4-beta-xylanase [Bowmanella pacifica]|uniref:Beta-xylanase n=1 Tax=Bowmanella pacifica TaxID=502051 RepID=A0A917YRJ3_9ALTE|nr:endo-1,4-beta-xylanase [Bowmanella pacifica]GGO64705.1 beta-xylanase [Bowmanella pacifica]